MAREWHGGQANGTFCCCGQRRSLAEGGAEGGEVAMKRRMGTGLEDDVAFGIEDESAHIGDDRAAVGQEHAEDQADPALAPSSMKVSSWGIRKVSGGVASAAVGASTARAAAMPMPMTVRIGRPRSRVDIGASPVTAPLIAVRPG